MKFLFGNGHDQHRVRGTARIEAWSDAVIAIIITLLVIELHVPELTNTTLEGVLTGLQDSMAHILTFAFSFLSLAVFWVNHHHFFVELDHADAHLMWYNNLLLFWLALVPFTTNFVGTYPTAPGVIMLYAFVLFMAALAFMLMTRHAFYVGKLVHDHIDDATRNRHYRRGWVGVAAYGTASVLALVSIWCSFVLVVFVPLYYIAPRLMHDHENMEGH